MWDHSDVTLDASAGSWPADRLCTAYEPDRSALFPAELPSYEAFVEFRVISGSSTHVGLMYNRVDDSNYDFVYLFGHSAYVQCGKVVGGTVQYNEVWTRSAQPSFYEWNAVTVQVSIILNIYLYT